MANARSSHSARTRPHPNLLFHTVSGSIPRRRTRSREVALQFLYQLDLRGPGSSGPDEFLADLDAFLADGDQPAEVRSFARELIVGTAESRDRIDTLLRRIARNWDLERMATVDRNVLRLAVHELLDRSDIPPKVTINEAIELAKKFSTANSGAFVNGILDRVRIDHESSRKTSSPTPVDAPAGGENGDNDAPSLDASSTEPADREPPATT